MGIDSLAELLAGDKVQQQIAAENPYFQSEAVPNALQGTITKDVGQTDPITGKPLYSTGGLAAASAVNGLFGGILKGLGDRYQADISNDYANTLGDLLVRHDSSNSRGLPQSIFNVANNNAGLFKLSQDLTDSQKDRDNRSKIALETDPRALKAKFLTSAVSRGAMSPAEAMAALSGEIPTSTDSSEGLKKYAQLRNVEIPEGVTLSKGQIDKLAAQDLSNSKELSDSTLAEFDAVQRAKDSASRVLPMVQKIESSLTPDQKNLSWAEIKAQKLLPVNDISLVEQELSKLSNDLSNANPKNRVPAKEIDNLHSILSSDAPLAAGVSSGRIKAFTDQITSGFQQRINSKTYPGSPQAKAARFLLDQNSDVFNPLVGAISKPDPKDYDDPLAYKTAKQSWFASQDGR